jgi:hypothetical protein
MCRPRVDLADCLAGGPEDYAQHQNLDEVVFGSGLRHVPGMGKGQISKRSKDVADVYCEGTVQCTGT